jgi:hypothetical protein
MQALKDSGQHTAFFLDWHVRGDWGRVCQEDAQLNDEALGLFAQKESGMLHLPPNRHKESAPHLPTPAQALLLKRQRLLGGQSLDNHREPNDNFAVHAQHTTKRLASTLTGFVQRQVCLGANSSADQFALHAG